MDPLQGGSGIKHVRGHENFIPTMFQQNPSSGSGEEVENVKSFQTTPYDNSSLEPLAKVS